MTVHPLRICLFLAFYCVPGLSLAQDVGVPPAEANSAERTRDLKRDISAHISYISDRGVPVIENPSSCPEGGPNLTVTVNNIEDLKGSIVADLHDHVAEDFLNGEKVVLRIRAQVDGERVSFCLPLEAPGRYAVAVYHDRNDNRIFDKGFLRIPKERFGMSNDPVFGLGAPSFDETAFEVCADGKDITINLISSGDILKGNRR